MQVPATYRFLASILGADLPMSIEPPKAGQFDAEVRQSEELYAGAWIVLVESRIEDLTYAPCETQKKRNEVRSSFVACASR